MGLDMWLSRKKRADEMIESADVDLVYWRKANAIHAWFTQGVEEDNCARIPVSIEQVKELQKLCKDVVLGVEKPEDALPTKAGFFWGDTNMGKYYTEMLKMTVKDLDEVIDDYQEGDEMTYLAWY